MPELCLALLTGALGALGLATAQIEAASEGATAEAGTGSVSSSESFMTTSAYWLGETLIASQNRLLLLARWWQ